MLAKEDVASSKAKLRCLEGSPPEKSLSKGQRKERKEEGVELEVDCCGASSEFDFARILNLLILVLHLSLRLGIGMLGEVMP